MNGGGVLWICSFPKSGNTWLRILFSNLAEERSDAADINDLAFREIASDRLFFDTETLLDSGLLKHEEIDRLRPAVHRVMAGSGMRRRPIKVHDAFTRSADGDALFGGADGSRAVYLARDPRDVAVSMRHHYGISLDAAIGLLNAPDGMMGVSGSGGIAAQLPQRMLGWSGHVASWLDQATLPVLALRYEDLHADPERWFGEVLRFAGWPVDPRAVSRAVARSALASLQRQERERGFRERIGPSGPFFRSGQIGQWRSTLDPAQVASIERRHAACMIRLGYAIRR